jgi:hypothetical protein
VGARGVELGGPVDAARDVRAVADQAAPGPRRRDQARAQRDGHPVQPPDDPRDRPGRAREAQSLAESIRAGEVAGATLPYGFDLDLKGVSGTLPDTLASIRYCDEVMARSLMMMFTSLDQHGSRALGSSFIDYFKLTQETVADWYVDVTTAHVVEDWVDWNVGEDAQAPGSATTATTARTSRSPT